MTERELKLPSGWPVAGALLLLVGLIVFLIATAARTDSPWLLWVIIPAILGLVLALPGFLVNGPNQSRVVQLMGRYVGTVKDTGFFYGNPLYWRTRVSLRVRTFETGLTKTGEIKDAAGKVLAPSTEHRQPSKVNDRDGTPIEIAAVVVWRVVNSAEAVFQVDHYEEFVRVQSEAALRNLASRYPYDGHDRERSLRGNTAEIGEELKRELHERLHIAGVEIEEARISTLAYAPEIAAAMLQRQQAGAMIAARQQIVEAAVGMVGHALEELTRQGVVELDAERRAAMVANLMVVLCGHGNPQPVLNTGTLYN